MRAQVSIIAIAAVLVLLIVLGTFVVFRSSVPNTSGFEDVELAFSECIDAQMRELVPLAALHGGEIAYSLDYLGSVPRTVRDDQSRLVPLWTSFSSGTLSYTRPKLHPRDEYGGGTVLSIEEQFEIALNDRLRACLERVSSSRGVESDVRSVTSEVSLGDEISVFALATGSFTRDERTTTRLSGRTRFASSFVDLFESAQALSALDATTGLFGAYVEDIIALGSGVNERYPPIYEFDFGYSTRFWTADAVADSLADDLDAALPLIQFSSSMTPDDPPYLIRRGLVDFERDGERIGDDVFLSIERAAPPQVAFDGGRTVSGEPLLSAIPLFGDLVPIREYRTSYDVSVPLIVTLTSRSDGVRFRFAVEPRIDKNQVISSGSNALTGSQPAFSLARRAFCDDPTGAQVAVGLSGADPAETTLTYSCGSITCSYPYASMITLPSCLGGTLSAQAPNVRFERVEIDSRTASGSAFLEARSSVDAVTRARLVDTSLRKESGRAHALEPVSTRPIGASEKIIVTFSGVDLDHTVSTVITDAPMNVALYEGVYLVSVVALRDLEEAVVIPEREECETLFCIGGPVRVDEIRFDGTLILAQHADLGPIFISSGSSVDIEVPIFDLEAIPLSERVAEDLEFYDVLERSITGSEVRVS